MGEFVLKNGANGDTAFVDQNKRLHTETVIQDQASHASDSGIEEKYNINTGDITLTDANKTTTIYSKNTGVYDMVLTALIYNLGNSAGGSGDVKIDVLRNPTAGDIITNANDCLVGPGVSANQNFGSTNTMTGLFYKGATSEGVLSDGDVTITTRSASNTGRIVVSLGSMIVPKGGSIAVEYTPPTSNTSQIVQFAFACYIKTPTVSVQ